MEKETDNKDSQEKMKKAGKRLPTISERTIGANIAKIQERLNLLNPQFYDLLYPGTGLTPGGKSNEIARMKGGYLNLDKVITVAVKTNTPIAELFSGVVQQKKASMVPTAYDVCKAFMHMLTSGLLNIEGTRELREKKKVIPFEKEKKDLDKYYEDIPYMGPPEGPDIIDYPSPIYIRIMPRYFLKGDDVIEYKETDEIFTFIKNILELRASDLSEESKSRYMNSELEKVNKESASGEDFTTVNNVSFSYYYRLDFPPDYHEPW